MKKDPVDESRSLKKELVIITLSELFAHIERVSCHTPTIESEIQCYDFAVNLGCCRENFLKIQYY